MSVASMLSGTMTATAKPYILVVDDQPMCRETLRAVIESVGRRCVALDSGAEALAYTDRRRPEAVVTDLAMPGIDGSVLAHFLRARYPGMPIILVTGQDPADPEVDRLQETVDAILPKPIDPERLLSLLPAGCDERVAPGGVP